MGKTIQYYQEELVIKTRYIETHITNKETYKYRYINKLLNKSNTCENETKKKK